MQLHIDIYIWCAFQIFVFFKLVSNVLIQGAARAKTQISDYPEDAKGSKRVILANPANVSDLPFTRATNVFRNDLENIIPMSLVALAAAFVQVDARFYILLLLVYALSRISHSAFLIGGKQPLRSIAYTIALLSELILVILIIARLVPIFASYGA
jgi:uncharacterized MAPEG superfamily protein